MPARASVLLLLRCTAEVVGGCHGGQVWSFGGVSIIMDSATQLVRAQMEDRWAPVSLDGLLAEQRRRTAAKAAK